MVDAEEFGTAACGADTVGFESLERGSEGGQGGFLAVENVDVEVEFGVEGQDQAVQVRGAEDEGAGPIRQSARGCVGVRCAWPEEPAIGFGSGIEEQGAE